MSRSLLPSAPLPSAPSALRPSALRSPPLSAPCHPPLPPLSAPSALRSPPLSAPLRSPLPPLPAPLCSLRSPLPSALRSLRPPLPSAPCPPPLPPLSAPLRSPLLRSLLQLCSRSLESNARMTEATMLQTGRDPDKQREIRATPCPTKMFGVSSVRKVTWRCSGGRRNTRARAARTATHVRGTPRAKLPPYASGYERVH